MRFSGNVVVLDWHETLRIDGVRRREAVVSVHDLVLALGTDLPVLGGRLELDRVSTTPCFLIEDVGPSWWLRQAFAPSSHRGSL